MTTRVKCPGSFRDPSGFVFQGEDGLVYRQVNRVYEAAYRQALESGLYRGLSEAGLLIPHEDMPLTYRCTDDACAVLRPRMLPFVSYPYEWGFTQLKEAALLTLEIQRRALDYGMSLKDASAYNVQFDGVRGIFVDTLSFEHYREGSPWIAYGQFCRHFLAPLALMATKDVRLGKLLQTHMDGIPLDVASSLLPLSTWLRGGLLTHVHLHARTMQRHVAREKQSRHAKAEESARRMSRTAMRALIDHLESAVRGLNCPKQDTLWADYEDNNQYTAEAVDQKKRIVADYLARVRPTSVWDLGANTGTYSRLAAEQAACVIAIDMDLACVEMNVRTCRQHGVTNVLPLCIDLSNPSPGVGWANTERQSLVERGPADAALTLALVHHLAIGSNVPLVRVAAFFRQLTSNLVVEFVPKEDPQTQRLLASRADIFPNYSKAGFESAFQAEFTLVEAQPLGGCERVLYLMKAR